MFCLVCGAETPAGSATCPACGRPTPLAERADTGAQRSITSPFAPPFTPPMPAFAVAAPPFRSTTVYPTAGAHTPPQLPDQLPDGAPSSSYRLLAPPQLPQDAISRAILLTCLALALDLLAPWSIIIGVEHTFDALGQHPLVLLILFVIAAAPVVQPMWRLRPRYAIAPLIVGAFCLGVGVFYWLLLNGENATLLARSTAPVIGAPIGAAVSVHTLPTPNPVTPAFGLYLFLIGGAVLVICGYQFFLAAVLSSATAVAAPTPQPLTPAPAPTPNSPAATQLSDGWPVLAPLSQPLSQSYTAPVSSSPTSIPTPTAPTSPPAAPTPAPSVHIAQPGSAEWNQAPASPSQLGQARPGAHFNAAPRHHHP